MNEIGHLKCRICEEIYTDPIFLTCCGEIVCKFHINKLLWDSLSNILRCPMCNESLPKQKFLVVKPIKKLIEDVKEKKRNDPEYQLNNFKQRVEDIETFHESLESKINEKYFELKRKVNLDRESFKLEIDKLADEMIKKLDSYENDAKFVSECCDELISDMKSRLDEYEKVLVSFSKTDEDRRSKRVEIEKEITSLDKKIRDTMSNTSSHKSITHESISDEIKKMLGKLIVSIDY